jgi:hypothetical protein
MEGVIHWHIKYAVMVRFTSSSETRRSSEIFVMAGKYMFALRGEKKPDKPTRKAIHALDDCEKAE